jgi:hypothetical protein
MLERPIRDGSCKTTIGPRALADDVDRAMTSTSTEAPAVHYRLNDLRQIPQKA